MDSVTLVKRTVEAAETTQPESHPTCEPLIAPTARRGAVLFPECLMELIVPDQLSRHYP